MSFEANPEWGNSVSLLKVSCYFSILEWTYFWIVSPVNEIRHDFSCTVVPWNFFFFFSTAFCCFTSLQNFSRLVLVMAWRKLVRKSFRPCMVSPVFLNLKQGFSVRGCVVMSVFIFFTNEPILNALNIFVVRWMMEQLYLWYCSKFKEVCWQL